MKSSVGNNVEEFKYILKRIWRKYSPIVKQESLREMFSHQDGETKYAALMDSASEEETNICQTCRRDEIDGANCSSAIHFLSGLLSST